MSGSPKASRNDRPSAGGRKGTRPRAGAGTGGRRRRDADHPDGVATQSRSGAAPSSAVQDIDDLFRLPLSDFTAARNALAARLRKSGRAAEADALKALPRPSIAAWAVNQLFWHHRDAFDRLLATGARFYEAQLAQLSGAPADIRGALDARREVLSELARLAADRLRDAGHATAPDTMRRITTTLEALSSSGSAPPAAQAGRLTEDVLPPGFEVLAPLVSRVDSEPRAEGPTRVLPFRPAPPAAPEPKLDPLEAQRAARAAAQQALDAADHALQQARLTAQEAEAALKKAAAQAKEAELEKAAAEQRLAELAAVAEQTRAEALRVAAAAEEAAQALDEAERAHEAALAQLNGLDPAGT